MAASVSAMKVSLGVVFAGRCESVGLSLGYAFRHPHLALNGLISVVFRIAAIDRVVHHSIILDLMALDSYRAHEGKEAHDHKTNHSADQATEPEEVVGAGRSS